MNVLVYLIIAAVLLVLASKLYGGYVSNFFGLDPTRKTPAVLKNDGRDYVPTRTHVVFAHHFSAIAGAGPILGPTLALLYGLVPAWIWVVLGGIFIGAVHDFAAIFASIREDGRSVAEIARKTMGSAGFTLFILFTITMIVLVTSSFLNATAISLTSMWPIEKLGLDARQTLLYTATTDNGQILGRIGGIASTSVVIITLLSPLLGYLIYKVHIKTIFAYILATIVMAGSVIAGLYFPISFSPQIWMVLVSIYVLFAAGVPIWLILQPRDFINVQILYAGVFGLFASLFVGGIGNLKINMPATNLAEGVKNLGLLWPMLFVTVACGAISGFHALVAGGTTSKQISTETAAKKIGYNGMLLESALAVGVLLAVSSSLSFSDYRSIVWPTDPSVKSNPILAFSLAVGHLFNKTFHIKTALGTIFGILLVEGFVITSLDAAVRINRYLFEELWRIIFDNPPRIMRSFWFNSGLSVVLMWYLAYSNAFTLLWPVFGAANQLLAALTLVTIAVWFLRSGRVAWFIVAPAVFMMLTTLASLCILLPKYLAGRNYALVAADLALFVLAAGVIALAVRCFINGRGTLQQRRAEAAGIVE